MKKLKIKGIWKIRNQTWKKKAVNKDQKKKQKNIMQKTMIMQRDRKYTCVAKRMRISTKKEQKTNSQKNRKEEK